MQWDDDNFEPGIKVQLDWPELMLAAQIGIMRRIESIREGLKAAHGYADKDGWGIDIEGAAAEMAVCKAINQYYDASINTFKAPDVAVGRWQVRHSEWSNARLIVRPGDSDEDRFVLVVGKAPYYTVIGWIKGADAKRERLLDSPGGRPPAYFVPQSMLRSVAEAVAIK